MSDKTVDPNGRKEFRYPVKVLFGGKKIDAELILLDMDSIYITIDSKKYEIGLDDNYYLALRKLDQLAGKDGYRILCNGTSKDVFCAGFCVNMARGFKVYYKNPKTGKLEVKNTFDYESWNEYATKEEQEKLLTGANEN